MLLRYERIGTREVDDYRAWRSSAIGTVLGESTEVRRRNTYAQIEDGRG
jgi:hypothetical protein